MNFRLAELARRFTDIITHLTEQPFTWGAGTGNIEDQADLVGALGEKADKENTYTKQESDDLLADKFDKSGGTIEGVTDIITPGASALVIQRTGVNAQSVRLRIIGTGNSGESPEATIDSLPDDDDIPLYVPGRISTGAGFYIGATRKDQDWDAKVDQSELDATNQALAELTTPPVLDDVVFTTPGIVTEIVTPQKVRRMGDLVRITFDIRVDQNNALESAPAQMLIPIPQASGDYVGNGIILSTTYGYNNFSLRQWNGSPAGQTLLYHEGLNGYLTAGDDQMNPGVRFTGVMEIYINP